MITLGFPFFGTNAGFPGSSMLQSSLNTACASQTNNTFWSFTGLQPWDIVEPLRVWSTSVCLYVCPDLVNPTAKKWQVKEEGGQMGEGGVREGIL